MLRCSCQMLQSEKPAECSEKLAHELRFVVCLQMIAFTKWNDSMRKEYIRNILGSGFWSGDAPCLLRESVCHHYDKFIFVFHSRKWAEDVNCISFEGSGSGERLPMSFAFEPFAITRACCTVSYRVINVIRHVPPKEYFFYHVAHASLNWMSRNWSVMVAWGMRILSDTGTIFWRHPSIFDARTRRPLWSTRNPDPFCPSCAVASR